MTTIAAVVLAAGSSRRMGQSKMTLPWGDRTVIEQVVAVLESCSIDPVLVVTGGYRQEVEHVLAGTRALLAHNDHHEQGEMLSSLQVGLAGLPKRVEAALVTLGDQPHLQAGVIDALLARYWQSEAGLVVPSYQMRRGHPWLVRRDYWPELLSLSAAVTLRDFLHAHAAEIAYLPVDTPSVLKDLDTPQDYVQDRPNE